jgi:hypothetical protein
MANDENKVIMLINGDMLIGKTAKGENEAIIVENPYTVEDLGEGMCVLPYCLTKLMDPMKFISFQAFNILWLKNLSDFPQVQEQYLSATTGIDL